MSLAVRGGISPEELVPHVQKLQPAGSDIIVDCTDDSVRLFVPCATDVIYDFALKCTHVHLASGLFELKMVRSDELGPFEVEVDDHSWPFNYLLKQVCLPI